ncbi:hypothetical protein VNO78_10429 [Psophocarpus tetragonolobus]|uniref:Uncharacterized protein n=1 Tax=Psophocarpus tetragonolobus TaxID=3891 RepID=A0AAN9XMQ5_PSOTE
MYICFRSKVTVTGNNGVSSTSSVSPFYSISYHLSASMFTLGPSAHQSPRHTHTHTLSVSRLTSHVSRLTLCQGFFSYSPLLITFRRTLGDPDQWISEHSTACFLNNATFENAVKSLLLD